MDDLIKEIEKMLINGNLKFKRKIMDNPESIPNKENTPKYPILIITCMDPRIDVYKIFQLNPGDIFVFKNAGNVYTNDMLRSILVTIIEFNIKYVIILGHLDCGMTKVNLKEFRAKLPSEFLSQLSKNYTVILSEIDKFFLPFNNEVENVRKQIKNVATIKSLFPEIEITGMIYDVKTGLIFEYDLFKDNKSFENFEKMYKELIIQKKEQFANFLIIKKGEDIPSDESKNPLLGGQSNEAETSTIQQINQGIEDSSGYKEEESEQIKIRSIMPKISVPKIQFHKVKIYIPTIVRKKKKITK
jgi:carbonic anhydrase